MTKSVLVIPLRDLERFLMDPNSSEINSTYHRYFEFNLTDAISIMKESKDEKLLDPVAEIVLIVIYAVLMAIGLSSNILVSYVVARRQQMHTARNLYIVNLTVSDITLCVVCMPITLVRLLHRSWTLGSILCKLVPMLQGTNIMVSIGTITVIALDRYFAIVRQTSDASNRRRVLFSIVLTWTVSCIATFPVFFFRELDTIVIPPNIIWMEICIERWPFPNGKLYFTIFVMFVQYVIPILVITSVHVKIASYLRLHAKTQRDSKRAQKEMERNKKTTYLLSCISIVFAVSWLPLHIFTVLADANATSFFTSARNQYLTFAVCHIVAMTSSFTNPIVYGWLNTNIRREFIQLLPSWVRTASSCLTAASQNVSVMDETTKNTRKESVTMLLMPPKRNTKQSAVSQVSTHNTTTTTTTTTTL